LIQVNARQRRVRTLGSSACRDAREEARMNTVVRLLTEDHAHFRGLLDVLLVEAGRIERGEAVWLELLDDAVGYLHDYAEAVHHPVEERLMQVVGRAPSTADALHCQHADLEQRLADLCSAFAAVHDDHPHRRTPLVAGLRRVASGLREHIDWEEAQLFVVLAACDDGPWLETDADGGVRCFGITLRPLAPRFRNLLEWQGAAMQHAARGRTAAANAEGPISH
jgi:hemerythrin-like domain-containing protein